MQVLFGLLFLTSLKKVNSFVKLRSFTREKSYSLHMNNHLSDIYQKIISPESTKTLTTMFVVSGPLGMFLDNYHGLFGVLHYFGDSAITLSYNGNIFLKSALWVPILFGVAGLAMSAILMLLDDKCKSTLEEMDPDWPKTLYGISFFSGQYYISGLLDSIGAPVPLMHVSLAAIAAAGFLLFDRSAAGLALGAATAIAGPVAEIFLVNRLHLYEYTHADFVGVCSWIPWVYLLGAPAVGNLSRRLHLDLNR
eukprot:gene10260-21405_t